MLDKLLNSLVAMAPVALLAGILLAAGFRRNRVVWLLSLLALDAWGWHNAGRDLLIALAAPALALWISVRPERPLLSPRNLILAGATALMLWFAGGLGEAGVARLQAWNANAYTWPAGLGTIALLYFGAAFVCSLHWFQRRGAADMGASAALACAALAAIPSDSSAPTAAWLTLGALLAVAGVLVQAFRMAFVDALTGLPNRRALDEELARSEGRLAVAMVDVDHFKRFNDRHGHDAGDVVLRNVARALRRCRGGHAFRYGGEEFSIVFTHSDMERISEALDLTRKRIQETRVRLGKGRLPKSRPQAVRKGTKNGEVHVTVSIGLAGSADQHAHPQLLIEAADKALYKAKRDGRNRLVVA
ncbi:MAG: GGDEF domain-containing protein [Xanthomonadales bacterium]|nr:GGDEF domain-containing protein [Xanthomonadales bacterium]